MKFQELKEKYKKAQKSHKETKNQYKNCQRSYSLSMLKSGDLEKKNLKYPYQELSDLEKSQHEIRIFHIAYSLIRGTTREKIEKETNFYLDKFIEAKVLELINNLGVNPEIIRNEKGSIIQIKREVKNDC